MTPKFHSQNRQKLAQQIGDQAIAIIDTSARLIRRGDFEYQYRPDSNFYYLTGIAEPEAVLILAPGQTNPASREMLFISGTSDFVGQWEGERHTPETAAKTSGIKTVVPLTELERYIGFLTERYPTAYLNALPASAGTTIPDPSWKRATALRHNVPTLDLKSALPLLDHQRMVKDKLEVEYIKTAVQYTKQALDAVTGSLAPHQTEYQLAAKFLYEIHTRGAVAGFTPIVAAGGHSTVIHYTGQSGKTTGDGLVLFDVGAEVGYYTADISRTVPVSGKFTPRQQAVYDVVAQAQAAGIAAHKPGTTLAAIDKVMRRSLKRALSGLELKGDLNSYYPHMSHHLGLDVHDTGTAQTVLEPGMVVTCEPGLYIADEGIGVRLEDDILITSSGHEVL